MVNDIEATTVHNLFEAYLRLGSTKALAAWAKAEGISTKIRFSKDGAIQSGGKCFSRGNLHALLSYRTYIGEVTHKGNAYPGEHMGIIPRELWDRVQARLTAGNPGNGLSGSISDDTSLLTGLLFDETGDRLTPSHANKQGSRYRYYVARRLVEENAGDPTGWRLPATEIERVVISALLDWLKTPRELMDVIGNQYLATTNLTHFLKSSRQLSDTIQKSSTRERRKLIIPLVARVTIGNGGLTIRLCHDAMLKAIDITSGEGLTDSSVSDYHEILIPFSLRRRGVEARLIVGGGQPNQAVDPVLVPALATAHAWFHQLASGNVASINGIAREQGLAANEISRILPLAFLAPDIVEAIIAGKQPPELTAKQLKRFDCMPLDWQQQRQILGFPSSSNR